MRCYSNDFIPIHPIGIWDVILSATCPLQKTPSIPFKVETSRSFNSSVRELHAPCTTPKLWVKPNLPGAPFERFLRDTLKVEACPKIRPLNISNMLPNFRPEPCYWIPQLPKLFMMYTPPIKSLIRFF